MSKQRQRQRRRRRIYSRNGWVASRAKRKRPSEQDENSLGSQIKGYSGSKLPEDIWCFIHSLLPMRDAAQAACVSQAFLRSWICHPKLHFSENTLLGSNKNARQNDDKVRDFNSRIDCILKNHSGIGLKALKFEYPSVYNGNSCHLAHLDSWLQIAVKPGIEELSLRMTVDGAYNFPCSLLSGETGDQLRYLSLAGCQLHSIVRLGCLRRLTRLQLTMVHITSSELECLLSSSFALETFELRSCDSIVCLKIPCLQQLSYLEVVTCTNLKVIESKAPNLCSFWFAGGFQVKLSLGETWRIKKLHRHCSNFAFYARTELPSTMPNLESLTIRSDIEMVSTPMVPSKFLHLKFLSIAIGGVTFDYLSLISFLDAAPLLETFIVEVMREWKKRVSVFEDRSDLRMMPGHHHSKLKHVKIIKFSSAKSVAELICQILESATSLECLTLDTTHGMPRCSVNKTGKCLFMLKYALVEAHEGLLAAKTYIKPKVPSKVELNVLEPCIRCHAVGL
ncbi:hypothetical protein HU200_017523 [Digitaria exilis]|uniref:At1g61320/AtMIF1 LRR domain-containing protein n=1 Tax=Digitaria exilis TaxID=1010633 RepID=A0A835F646_9POAL|nr:hypothetical protein HU200_017523 [Digitaria exilis]